MEIGSVNRPTSVVGQGGAFINQTDEMKTAVAKWKQLGSDALIHPVQCFTCEGAGSVESHCVPCDGLGKRKCGYCQKFGLEGTGWVLERIDVVYSVLNPDGSLNLRESLPDLRKEFVEQKNPFVWNPPDGLVRCPAACNEGKSVVQRGKDCLVCDKKGGLKCKACNGRCIVKCVHCSGKGQSERSCPECVGLGKGNDPLKRTVDAQVCPWCNHARIRDCKSCKTEIMRKLKCSTCRGSGKFFCGKCAGHKKVPCKKCFGTGEQPSYSWKDEHIECSRCEGKGSYKCFECKCGKTTCPTCKGKKEAYGYCRACLGFEVAPCEGCMNSTGLAWRVTAERLYAAGKIEEAIKHMEVAVRRAYVRKAMLLDSFDGESKDFGRYKRGLEKWIAGLEKQTEEYQSMYQEKDSNGSNNSVPMSSSAPDQ